MKKSLILILTLCILLSMTACGKYKAQEPLQYPDYTFASEPTTEELRQTAVRAMRDLLSIQWCTREDISYYKKGSKTNFRYPKDMTFGGVIYSGASTGLLHFMEFYNNETGELSYPGTVDEMKESIGSACADSLLWSWSTVCNSISGGYYPTTMVYQNGFLPVGDYTYNFNTNSYYTCPTNDIIKANGTDVIADAYTKTLPADALISTTQDHAMMVIEMPVVVYDSNGKIDTEQSYLVIQDQRGGIRGAYYDVEHDGYTVHHSGRVSCNLTFNELLEKNYIPVTAAEFTGEKAYEIAQVTVEGGTVGSIDTLPDLKLVSNYPIAIIRLITTDADGKDTLVQRILITSASDKGPAKSFDVKDLSKLTSIDTGKCAGLRIEVVSSTGQTFTPVNLSF